MRFLQKLKRYYKKKRSIIAHLLLIMISPLIFFGLTELCLGLIDIEHAADAYAGIYDSFPFFTIHNDTVHVNNEKYPQLYAHSFPLHKSPNTIRVFIFGGSNIYNLSHYAEKNKKFTDILKEKLQLQFPQKDFEIINAGGNSWGSFHVVKLARAVLQFKPDIYIVYSGHNDFRWIDFSQQNKLNTAPLPLIKIYGILSKFRTFSLMTHMYRNMYAHTISYYNTELKSQRNNSYNYTDQFQKNIEYTAKLCKKNNIKMILSTVSSNLVFRPNLSSDTKKQTYETWNEYFNTATQLIIDLLPYFSEDFKDIYFHPQFMLPLQTEFPEDHYRQYTHFSYLEPSIQEEIRIYYSHVFNKDNQKKFLTFFHDIYDSQYRYSQKEKDLFAHALHSFKKAEEIYSEHAMLNFYIGLCSYALSDFKTAKIYLLNACMLDRYPGRATLSINNAIINTAEKYNTDFFDMHKIIEDRSTHNIPGWEYFRDDCHLNKNGRMIFIDQCFESISKILSF